MLVFDITDTGIGMSEDHMGLLFRPFSPLDGSSTRRFGGTGWGLAISKRLAEILGGDITVRSIPGKGSTFSLTVATGSWNGLAANDEAILAATISEPRSPQPSSQGNLNCRISSPRTALTING